MERVTN